MVNLAPLFLFQRKLYPLFSLRLFCVSELTVVIPRITFLSVTVSWNPVGGSHPQTPPERGLGRRPNGFGRSPSDLWGRAMIQSSHRFCLATSSPNLFESSLPGWALVLGFAALTPGPFGLANAHSPLVKLDSDKFRDSTAGQTGGLD